MLIGFLLVLTTGCASVSEPVERPQISMAEDTTAYIQMLEEEITQRVLKEERDSRSLMMFAIILTVIVSSVIVDKIAIAKRKTEIRNK